MDLQVSLLPWQQEVFNDKTRFKVIPAGRRVGKSQFAAWKLIIEGLANTVGNAQVLYVAPTQGQAREIMWDMLLDLGRDVIKTSHVNNLQITLINGTKISLKGADRPETMRGLKIAFLVMDEYADMKPEVWEQILRPALSDLQGEAIFIGTPMGRNHFFELYQYAELGNDDEWIGYTFTTYDNPTIPKSEVEAAKKSMSSFSFRQEFLASFESIGSEIFKEDWIQYNEKEPNEGDYYISIDLGGFGEVGKSKLKNVKLDETAISIVKVNTEGWWVKDIIHGRWGVEETARKIFEAVAQNRPISVGIEKGISKNAVMPYLRDLMKRKSRFFTVEDLIHGNQKKTDRIVWGLQGRFEHGNIALNKGEWNMQFLDQLFQFPNPLVHDDLVDSLAYIDQIASVAYSISHIDVEDFDILDTTIGF
jgi:predicted phage terminase large subunit-like protein